MTATAEKEEFNFDNLRVEDAGSVLNSEEPTTGIPEDQQYSQPDESFVKPPPRPRAAKAYEKKVGKALNTGMRLAIQNPETVADAAAIIMYGPSFATAMGDWAAESERVARAIDFITEGTDNSAAKAFLAFAPFALQVFRNHEPVAEVEPRQFRIRVPFRKKPIFLRLKLRLGRVRNLTNDPSDLTTFVFSNPAVAEALQKQGIQVADIQQRRRFRRKEREQT